MLAGRQGVTHTGACWHSYVERQTKGAAAELKKAAACEHMAPVQLHSPRRKVSKISSGYRLLGTLGCYLVSIFYCKTTLRNRFGHA